jgi:hypothetical protein
VLFCLLVVALLGCQAAAGSVQQWMWKGTASLLMMMRQHDTAWFMLLFRPVRGCSILVAALMFESVRQCMWF